MEYTVANRIRALWTVCSAVWPRVLVHCFTRHACGRQHST